MKTKSSLIITIACLIFTSNFIPLSLNALSPVFASDRQWKYPEWQYRLLATVGNESGKEKNNYTISIKIQNNNHFFTNTSSNGQDIRITDSNHNPIPFWIRSHNTQTQSSVINARLPVLRTGDNSVYVYYGNQSATSLSDPHATFDYYQDFSSFNPSVKFGIFTDIHHDSNSNNQWTTPDFQEGKLGDARPRLQNIISNLNSWNADFLITLGDLITSEDWVRDGAVCNGHINNCNEVVESPDLAATALSQIESTFSTFNNQRYYALDNHEYYNLSLGQVLDIIGGQGAISNNSGIKQPYHSFDQGGIRFIILDFEWDYANNRHRGPEGASDYGESYIHPDQLSWLDNQLTSSPIPVVIFSPSRLEDHDFLTFEQCQNYQQYNYCTDQPCSDGSCVDVCNQLYDYRWVRNSADIRAVLEAHHQKIMAVFQGDHHARYHYNQNGINYFSLKSADQIDATDVAFVKVEVDPVSKLLAIEGVGGTNDSNKFKISYESGKMVIDNHRESSFLPAPLVFDRQWNRQNDVLIEAGWTINPQEPSQQLAIGFWENLDYPQIRHRCAENGRLRRSNFAGARRVFSTADNPNYLGTQQNLNGASSTTLDTTTTSTTGYFWVQKSDGIIRSWYNTDTQAGKLSTDIDVSSQSTTLTPGIWVFDNTTNSNKAYIDNVIVRTAVYPEPVVTNLSSPTPTPLPHSTLITHFNKPGTAATGDLNGDSRVNIFDLNHWISLSQ